VPAKFGLTENHSLRDVYDDLNALHKRAHI